MSSRAKFNSGAIKVGMALATALVANTGRAQNLVANASFEDQFVELFNDVYGAQGWNAFERSFTTRYLARTGDQSFKTFSNFVGGASGIFQDHPAVAGQTFVASVWAANPSFDALGADQAGFLNIEWRNEVGMISFDSVTVVNGTDTPFDTYQNATLTATAPAGTTTARIVLLTGAFFDRNGDSVTQGGGSVYFDDASLSLAPAAPMWQTNGNGDWEDSANWQGGLPNSPGAAANFITALSSPAVITLGSSKTVGTVKFDSSNGYTLQGSTLILDNAGDTAVIEAVSGMHVISSDVDAIAGLRVSGPGVTLGGRVKVGGELEVVGGEVRFTGSLAQLTSLQVSGGGVLNVTSASFLLDYGVSSPIADLIAQYLAGEVIANSDDGFGLPTYLAIAEAADLGLTEFAGAAVDDSAVVAKFTYVGDANLDGQVDALDYERVDLAIGNTGVLGTAQGDLNYDGNVDALDYEQIDLNIGNGVGSPLAAVVVPEPASLSVVAIAACLSGRRRRR